MLATKIKIKQVRDNHRNRLEASLARELPHLDSSLQCAAEYEALASDSRRIEVCVSGKNGRTVGSLPTLLFTARAPALYGRYVQSGEDEGAAEICELSRTTVPSAQILVYWLFTGSMPISVTGARDATDEDDDNTGVAAQRSSTLHPWLEAWILGQDHHIPQFQRLVMRKIDRVLARFHGKALRRYCIERGEGIICLLTPEDVEYVQSRVPEPAIPSLDCLRTFIHILLTNLVKCGSISMQEFGDLLDGEGFQGSMVKTMEWLMLGEVKCDAEAKRDVRRRGRMAG